LSVRVVAVSDLHGWLPSIPPCDLLLLAGDLCPLADHSDAAQRAFLAGPFRDWLEGVPAGAIAAVAGNHDLILAREPELLDPLPLTYLCDGEAVVAGLRIWGSPYAVTFGDWAFMEGDAELEERFAVIPEGLDVVMVHGPPFEVLDRASRGVDTGSHALRHAILRARPAVGIFGHIHEAHGEALLGDTRCFNVSLVDRWYVVSHAPTTFDLEPRSRPI
jgi:predicted phosphohydrolase